MLKTLPVALVLALALPLAAHAARNSNFADMGENPCQGVANTCSVSGFTGKDIWTKCVEPLKKGKKVVTADGTVVEPDVPLACKTGKAGGQAGGHRHHGGDDDGSAPPAGDNGAKPGTADAKPAQN